MSTLYHAKFHGHNHHTKPADVVKYPDAARDPIASYEHPYQGSFVCDDKIVAYDDNLTARFANPNIALSVSSSNISISANNDVLFYDSVEVGSFSVPENKMYAIDTVNTSVNGDGTFWLVYINSKPYGVRLWDQKKTYIEGHAPTILSQTQDEIVPATFIKTLSIDVRGTYPLNLQWYVNNIQLDDETQEILHVQTSGVYICVATNYYGEVSSENISIEIDARAPHFLEPIHDKILTTSTPVFSFELTTSAIGAEPIHYRWYKNNIPLQLTNNTKHLVNEPGIYHVTATNYVSSVTSSYIHVVESVHRLDPLDALEATPPKTGVFITTVDFNTLLKSTSSDSGDYFIEE